MLLSCIFPRNTMRIILPERRSADQNTTMSELARTAEKAWRQPGHPGWYAVNCKEDGETLQDLFRQRVYLLYNAGHHLQCQQRRLGPSFLTNCAAAAAHIKSVHGTACTGCSVVCLGSLQFTLLSILCLLISCQTPSLACLASIAGSSCTSRSRACCNQSLSLL